MASKKTLKYRNYLQTIGGERFYTLARWVMLILLLVISYPTLKSPLWPISFSGDLVVIILWLYAIFAIFMTVALFIPPMKTVVQQGYLGDIGFIVLLALLTGANPHVFLPFYFLPIISAAIRMKPLPSLGLGFVTAIFYVLAAFIGTGQGKAIIDMSLGLQSIMLVVVPWLTSSLVEQWSSNNRRAIAEADQRRQLAQNKTQEYKERMKAYTQVASILSLSMDPAKVINSTLEELRKITPYTYAMIIFPTGQPKELKIEVIEPLSPTDGGKTFITGDGTIAEMMRPASKPRMIDDISKEVELQTVSALRSCTSSCLLPLRMKGSTFGLMIVASEEQGYFHEEDFEMMQGISNYLIVALHTAQTATSLRQIQRKLIAQEKEIRDRMASKLHDGPTQKVAQIKMQAEFIKKAMQKDPAMVPDELDRFAKLAEAANAEMRMTLFELRPLTLESDGLRAALKEYVEKLKIRTGKTEVLIKSKGSVDSVLSKQAEGVIFDIIQESINNALKHAEADHIWIMLERKGNVYTAMIKDDGKGFDLQAAREDATKRASFGLKNFDERAEMIDGNVEIESAPGEGTTIKLMIALEATPEA